MNDELNAYCRCRADDPALLWVGALNNLSGWLVTFIILHEVLGFRVLWHGNFDLKLYLMSPLGILAGLGGSWISAAVLGGSVQGYQTVFRSNNGFLFVGSDTTAGVIAVSSQVVSVFFLVHTNTERVRKVWIVASVTLNSILFFVAFVTCAGALLSIWQ